MIRAVVVGSRGFDDYERLKKKMDEVLFRTDGKVEIVSGHAKGADQLGEKYAAENGIPVAVMRPDWKRYGRAAGFVRNREMLEYAAEETAVVIAFWDGKSKGTKNTIETAKKLGLTTEVDVYENDGQSA